MNIGSTIYKLRTAKNLSQEELAEQLDVSRQSVSKWETDASVPDLDKLLKLCEIFEVTLDELVGREVPKEETAGPPQPQVIVQTIQTKNSTFTPQRIVGYILLAFALFTPILLQCFVDGDSALAFVVIVSFPVAILGGLLISMIRGAAFWFIAILWKQYEITFLLRSLGSVSSTLMSGILYGLIKVAIYVATCIGIGLISRKYLSSIVLSARWNKGILVTLGWIVHMGIILLLLFGLIENGFLGCMLCVFTCIAMIIYTTLYLIHRKKAQ